MAQVTLELGTDKIREIIFQLPAREFLSLAAEIEQRAETVAMMRLSESGFREWEEKGEDIYDDC